MAVRPVSSIDLSSDSCVSALMPWSRAAVIAIALLALGRPAAAESTRATLPDQYGSARGYRVIKRAALAWHRTTRYACVAVASTALRHVGVPVPRPGPDGTEAISRLTKQFAEYLEVELGWTRITDADALQRGDFLFTTDAPCCPGYPAHVMVLLGWRDQGAGLARIVDNIGRDHVRPLAGDADRDQDPFAFALRPPS